MCTVLPPASPAPMPKLADSPSSRSKLYCLSAGSTPAIVHRISQSRSSSSYTFIIDDLHLIHRPVRSAFSSFKPFFAGSEFQSSRPRCTPLRHYGVRVVSGQFILGVVLEQSPSQGTIRYSSESSSCHPISLALALGRPRTRISLQVLDFQ